MTYLEYNKHYRAKYDNAKEKITNYNTRLNELIEKAKEELNKEFVRIEQYNFPDMLDLHKSIMEKFLEIEEEIKSYCENHELLIAVNNEYLKNDPIKAFWDSLNNNVLQQFSFKRIYQICDEGEKRFKNKTPPGFKDKEKQGLRQFGDLILWNEILEISKANSTNVLFVTDDGKEDWWEAVTVEDNLTKQFHSKLIAEFKKETKMEIIAITSSELYSHIANEYGIEKQDTIEMALSQTNEDYISSIEDEVFDDIQDDLLFSQEEYITGYNNIGSEGLSDFELEDRELIDYEILEQNENYLIYILTFAIKLSASSCEYWGRDDDTKEIITSPENHHIFEGTVRVRIERVIDSFIDLMYEETYSNPEIDSCELQETEFIEYCDYSENFDTDLYNICPRCGRKMTFEDDAGNGFCINCTRTDDSI